MIFVFLLQMAFASDTATICYLSLNNEKEFTVTQTYMDGLNKKTGKDIRVLEFQNPDVTMNPEESFKRMIESGAPCDGLVISGHHYGSFGGKQADGQLSISFIEKLSCDPKYKDFFENIKSLWLQGCRTLGVGPNQAIVTNEADADFHTNRVGGVLAEDHLEASFADLNMEFSATLDQDNPLSSRYLRVFPRATVFGWTKTAPGENAGSQYSLAYHIAHIAALNDDRAAVFKSPAQMTDTEAMSYANAVLGLFKPDKGDTCEFKNVDAWLKHGRVKDNSIVPGFDNPDIQAYPALQAQDNPKLKQAKDLACLLERSDNKEETLKVLDVILADKDLIAYNFNNVWETVQRLKNTNMPHLKDVLEKLQKSESLNMFLSQKLTSRSLGILRKIDYYGFLRDISKANAEIENKILDASSSILDRQSKNYDELDFQITLIQSLAKNDLLANDKGFRLLSAVAKSKDEQLRATIATQAPNLGNFSALMLESLQADTSPRVRGAVAGASYFIGEAGKPIIERLRKDSNENVRWEMVERLQRHPNKQEAIKILRDFIMDDSTMVREVVVDVAAALDQRDILFDLTNDPNELVRSRAKIAVKIKTKTTEP